MKTDLSDNQLGAILKNQESAHRAILFHMNEQAGRDSFSALLQQYPDVQCINTLESQLHELMRISFPAQKTDIQQSREKIKSFLSGKEIEHYGVWAYYPWLSKAVRLLDEENFIKVRTSRNIYKIQPEEVPVLRKKKIGVIGLSVGQSIAMTLAMESTCGEIRLADFDDVELSNMNRIRVGVHELGMNKTLLAARQIAEIDPFIKVSIYPKGLNLKNIDQFLNDGGKLDILVEECDGIDIKIISRIRAKSFGIPVVMDTNDTGMLDVERFDLEPNRPIFHGKLNDMELSGKEALQQLANLTVEQKIGYLAKIIGMENTSEAMRQSLTQMNKTIVGWPQLASAVVLGGAMVTDTCRRILLDKFRQSGRYFVDFSEIIK